jgi:GWxTD domain-containing protein
MLNFKKMNFKISDMKRIILLGLLLFTINTMFALNVNISTNTFKGIDKNYVEFYMQVVGNTLHFKSIDSTKMEGTVEVTLLFKQGEKIINFDKYTLNSPIFNQKNLRTLDFIDVRRYPLIDGDYDLEIKIKDINRADNIFEKIIPVRLNYVNEKVQISDIQLIDTYVASDLKNTVSVKNGYYLEQHTTDLYEIFMKELTFYIEVYDTDKYINADYVVKYYVDKKGKNEGEPLLMRYKRMQPQSTNAMILTLNIADLPTGDYTLYFEVKNRKNELIIGKSIEFKRANPFLGVTLEAYQQTPVIGSFVEEMMSKQVTYCLKTIAVNINQNLVRDLNELIKSDLFFDKKRFLYTYWLTKDHNTPEVTFFEYMKKVDEANKRYNGTVGHGFQSDRGNIFLRFGEPNEIIREVSDNVAPPYEIWRYNSLEHQQDVKFVFYDPDLAGNNFILLHSTKRGEVNNPQWKRQLYKNDPQQNNRLNGTEVDDEFGRNVNDNFNGNN